MIDTDGVMNIKEPVRMVLFNAYRQYVEIIKELTKDEPGCKTYTFKGWLEYHNLKITEVNNGS